MRKETEISSWQYLGIISNIWLVGGNVAHSFVMLLAGLCLGLASVYYVIQQNKEGE